MTGPQHVTRVPSWLRPRAIAGILCATVLGFATSCTPGRVSGTLGTSVQAVVSELEQGRARGIVTISGIVTDDDPAADQTLVADDSRGILVSRAPFKTRPARGSRVVLEGALQTGEGGIPTLTSVKIVSIKPGTLPEAVLIEAGELALPRFLGQRVQLKAQLQGLTPAADRVRLTATSRAIQYDVDVRGIPRAVLTGFLGAQVRIRGTVWPARISPAGEPLGRLALSSFGDLEALDQGV